MDERTMQALREGRIAPITISADLSQCTFVPLNGKGADNGGDDDRNPDGTG